LTLRSFFALQNLLKFMPKGLIFSFLIIKHVDMVHAIHKLDTNHRLFQIFKCIDFQWENTHNFLNESKHIMTWWLFILKVCLNKTINIQLLSMTVDMQCWQCRTFTLFCFFNIHKWLVYWNDALSFLSFSSRVGL